tara:strand:- start:12395 stop:12790 length:396 start_codon:yes stop_codon:yes gene_type:complete
MTTNKPTYALLERANNDKHIFNKQLSDKLKEALDESINLRLQVLHIDDERKRNERADVKELHAEIDELKRTIVLKGNVINERENAHYELSRSHRKDERQLFFLKGDVKRLKTKLRTPSLFTRLKILFTGEF